MGLFFFRCIQVFLVTHLFVCYVSVLLFLASALFFKYIILKLKWSHTYTFLICLFFEEEKKVLFDGWISIKIKIVKYNNKKHYNEESVCVYV